MEPIFKNILASYRGGRFYQEIAAYGGAAGGKSEHFSREGEFWLPENEGDEMLVVTYSPKHGKNTLKRFTRVMDKHMIEWTTKEGGTELHFGNDNVIHFISAKAGSFEETQEKLKTFATSKPNALKFIWFEEFTATINLFKSYETFIYSASRLFREMREDSIIFYAWNPPRNRKHPIYKFLDEFEGLKLKVTMYDLPKKWQSKVDLKVADKLKRTNPTAYRHTYLGEDVGDDGLAFIIDEGIFTEMADNYISFHYLTDEGTANASTFMLIGVTAYGQVHCISSYKHSGKFDGGIKAPSQYADDFAQFELLHGVPFDTLTTDGLYFQAQLAEKGYKEAKSIHSKKDRALSYKLLDELIKLGNFKIVIHEDDSEEFAKINKNNYMLFKQLENAQLEESINTSGDTVQKVSKAPESSSNDEEEHLHLVDLPLYFCTRHQKKLIGGLWKDN